MKRKNMIAVLTSLALTAGMLMGTISSAAAESSTEAGTQSAEQQETPEKPDGWTEADATEELVYHVSASATTLSKWGHTANNTCTVLDYLIFDALLEFDEEGNVVPWLAESYELSDDYTTCTFHLRDGVYFTNGEKLTSEDVKYTFELLRDDTENYPDSVVKNWRNYLGELEAPDELTFVIHFSKPMPEFWKLVTVPDVQIVCKSVYEEVGFEGYWDAPVGTGPYVVESWDAPNSICKLTLRTDEHGYWGYDYAGTYTNVKSITVQYSPEATTRLASLRSGEVQLIDNIPTSDKAPLDEEGFVTTVTPPNNVVFLEFACGEGDAFSDPKLREAMSLCLDRQLLVDSLLDGYAIASEWLCMDTNLGYMTEEEAEEAGGSYYQYDPERAAQLVQESSYNGEALKFIYTTSTVNIGNELCQAIQSMAQAVGINLEINVLEVAVYDEARTAHEYDISLSSIATSVNMWFKQAADVIGEDRFNSGLTNEELIALGQEAAVTMDEEKMDQILKDMYVIQTTTFEPYINVYWPTVVYAQSSSLTNVQWHNYMVPDLSAVVLN